MDLVLLISILHHYFQEVTAILDLGCHMLVPPVPFAVGAVLKLNNKRCAIQRFLFGCTVQMNRSLLVAVSFAKAILIHFFHQLMRPLYSISEITAGNSRDHNSESIIFWP